MNFNNSLVCLFIFLCLNNRIKKCLMLKFYIPHSENLNYFKYKILHYKSFITVAKTCEKILRLNLTSTTKVKVKKSFIVKKS